jgi:hypothetical protein
MRKTMNGHVRIMIDTDRPMLKSHMAPTPHTPRMTPKIGSDFRKGSCAKSKFYSVLCAFKERAAL